MKLIANHAEMEAIFDGASRPVVKLKVHMEDWAIRDFLVECVDYFGIEGLNKVLNTTAFHLVAGPAQARKD